MTLAEIKSKLNAFNTVMKSRNLNGDECEFILYNLEASLAREEELLKALEKCAKPKTWHAPCLSCGEKMIEAGNYIAHKALAAHSKALEELEKESP